MTSLPETKVCTKCGVDKPLEDFHKDHKGKYGRVSKCKDCITIERGGVVKEKRPAPKEGHKYCSKCGEEKLLKKRRKTPGFNRGI